MGLNSMAMHTGSAGRPSNTKQSKVPKPPKSRLAKKQVSKIPNRLKEGSYIGLGEHLVRCLLNDSLPEQVCNELALASADLMQPMREGIKHIGYGDTLRHLLESAHSGKSIIAIRLLPFSGLAPELIDRTIYEKFREMFMGIRIPHEDEWMLMKKKYLSASLPYFHQYKDDDELKAETLSYFEATKSEQVESTLRYFGGIERWSSKFEEALVDESKRLKHWVYLWSYKTIREQGLFDEVTVEQLEQVIKSYRDEHQAGLSDFEVRILEQALLT